jgi:hypothetical protein
VEGKRGGKGDGGKLEKEGRTLGQGFHSDSIMPTAKPLNLFFAVRKIFYSRKINFFFFF